MSDKLSNDQQELLLQAIEDLKRDYDSSSDHHKINLAELERRTHISRSRLRRLQKNNFQFLPNGNKGKKASRTVITGFSGIIDEMLKSGVVNSSVIFRRISKQGYSGSVSTLKRYIHSHQYLVPAKRQIITPQGNRGRRYETDPGECYQMDWGFVKVRSNVEKEYQCACFVMVCHHCGNCYIEFFPNAKQENLFIGMIHAFIYMGIPNTVLTDNMRSITSGRTFSGNPVWQKDYEAFMRVTGLRTKLCKPRHPFTKGKVERLVRFVKENFIAGRTFGNITDLNIEAIKWCNEQNAAYHKASDSIPDKIHSSKCRCAEKTFIVTEEIYRYLCPCRKISYDGFVNYEGRRYGVPYSYSQKVCRVHRESFYLYILDMDMKTILARHNVTWSKKDAYCEDQYMYSQPEEIPTAPVKAVIEKKETEEPTLGFQKFSFEDMVTWDD